MLNLIQHPARLISMIQLKKLNNVYKPREVPGQARHDVEVAIIENQNLDFYISEI